MTSDTTSADEEIVVAAGPFIGWRIVGVAFLAQILSNGATISAFGNFTQPVAKSFGVGIGTIQLGIPMAIACLGLTGPFVGRLLDRGYVRIMMFSGAIACGCGLILLSRAEDIRSAALIWGFLVCLGMVFAGALPSMTMVSNWFSRRRGFALGASLSGATLVSYFGPAFAQFMIDSADWRTAALTFGVIMITIGAPVFGLLAVGRPEDVGQRPDGDVDEPVDGEAATGNAPYSRLAKTPQRILSPQELARDPRLWLVAIGFGLIMTSPLVLIMVLVPFAMGLGFTGQEANVFLAAAMPCSLAGKFGIGHISDRAPAKPIVAFIVVTMLAVWIIFYSSPSYPVYIATGMLYGFGVGGVAPLQGVVMGRIFGRANFGTASGLGGLPSILLLVAATTLCALLQGENGEGYPTVFLLQAGYLVAGACCLAIVRIPSVEEAVD